MTPCGFLLWVVFSILHVTKIVNALISHLHIGHRQQVCPLAVLVLPCIQSRFRKGSVWCSLPPPNLQVLSSIFLNLLWKIQLWPIFCNYLPLKGHIKRTDFWKNLTISLWLLGVSMYKNKKTMTSFCAKPQEWYRGFTVISHPVLKDRGDNDQDSL